MKRIGLSIVLSFTILASTSFASEICKRIFTEPTEREQLHDQLAEKYPTLAYIIQDPNEFLRKMQGRFEEQKRLTPENPYLFDYSEVGMTIFSFAEKSLVKKIDEIDDRIASIKPKVGDGIWGKLLLGKELRELKVAKQYYLDLQAETQSVLEKGSVSYQQTIEFSQFLSRALGHFDARKMPLLTRIMLAFDNRLQGYKQLSIEKEYDMYKSRTFLFFQKPSTVHTFKLVEGSFTDANFNRNKLERLVVPITDIIDRDILYALVPTAIDLEGVTYDPIAADGFLRPAGHFMNHDRRHNSVKLVERVRYIEKRNPSVEQLRRIEALQDNWDLELQKKISEIQDPDLKEAVDLTAFNWHHDRGYPFVPSIWLGIKKNPVIYALDFTLILSGQGTRFKRVIANTRAANKWLDEFWAEKLAEEESVFAN